MNPEKTEPDNLEEPSLEAIQGGGPQQSPPNGHNGSGGDTSLGPFDEELLLSMQVERREREARADKAEFQAEHEPKRLRMNLLERGAFVVVLVIAALAGAALIAVGVSSNIALVPTGCVLLSGATGTATYRIYRLRKQRGEEGDEPKK